MGRDQTNLLMVLVMLIVGIANLCWAEKLPVGDGLGWDGVNYAAWAKDFYKAVFIDKIEDYYVQRIAPSGLVHYGAQAVLRPFYSRTETLRILSENKNIVFAFGVYNLILVLLAVYVWELTAINLGISPRGRWFGFCFLFINYAILKLNFYTPVATDTSGFLLGLLMFYFFLVRKPLVLFAVMIIGSFTWPTLPYTAWLLLVFPRPVVQPQAALSQVTRGQRKLALSLSLLLCASVVVAFAYLLRHGVLEGWNKSGMVRTNFILLYSSMVAVIVWLFCGFQPIFLDSRLFDPKYIFKAIRWRWAIAGAAVFLASRLVVHELAGPVPSQWTLRDFVIYILASALTEPFIFLIAHVVYYGPVVLLLVIFWKLFCEEIGPFGVGFRLFIALNVVLSVCPQSRYQIPAVGAFVIILVKMLDRSWLQHWNFALWLLLSLSFSKIWYTFNTSPMNPDGTMAVFHTFPLQHLFMNTGPWMSHAMYVVQGLIVLATLILIKVSTARSLSYPLRTRNAAAL